MTATYGEQSRQLPLYIMPGSDPTLMSREWLQYIKLDWLAHYNPALPLKLAGDASQYGIGAVISHVDPNGDEHLIAYASKTLSSAEQNCSQIEKEALSLIYGLRPKKNISTLVALRMQRWAILFSAYNYQIKFRPTTVHGNADGLSR